MYRHKPTIRSERGSFLLFLGIAVFPVLLVFGSVGLSVLKTNKEYQNAQKIIDRAAISATKKLPFIPAATNSATSILESEGIDMKDVSLAVDASSVSIVYATEVPALLKRFVGTKQVSTLRVAARTQTAINARDIALFLDTSSYMAPVPSGDSGDEWNRHGRNEGNSNSAWPAASFFNRLQENSHKRISYRGEVITTRSLTQQCFNSAFSSHKEVAIRLYDYYAANDDNSIGVLIGPGANGSNVTAIRNITAPGTTGTYAGEGRFEFYEGSQGYNRDELCLAAAKYANENHKGYRVPRRGDTHLWGAAHFPDAPNSIMQNLRTNLAPAKTNLLSVRDILWTLAVRREASARRVDFRTVLEKTSNMLLGAPHRDSRGGMNHNTSKVGVLVMGDIPWVDGERLVAHGVRDDSGKPENGPKVNNRVKRKIIETLDAIETQASTANVRLQLYISVTKHSGNYPSSIGSYVGCVGPYDNKPGGPCPAFAFDTKRLANILIQNGDSLDETSGYIQGRHLQVQLLRSPDTEALATKLPAWLPLIDRTVMKVH
jgi:hypothetical protein